MEAIAGKSLSDLDLKGHVERAFISDNATLFKIMRDIAQTEFILDTSKDQKRLQLLLQVPSLEVLPIYLMRDPKGQICSVRERRVRFGQSRDAETRLIHDINHYNRKNRSIRSLLAQVPHFKVQYESLVTGPRGVATSILEHLSLSFEAQQMRWGEQVEHLVGGNRMRKLSSSEIKNDLRWKTLLSSLEKIAINVGTLPTRLNFRNSSTTINKTYRGSSKGRDG
jgi:hypothetical protein